MARIAGLAMEGPRRVMVNTLLFLNAPEKRACPRNYEALGPIIFSLYGYYRNLSYQYCTYSPLAKCTGLRI